MRGKLAASSPDERVQRTPATRVQQLVEKAKKERWELELETQLRAHGAADFAAWRREVKFLTSRKWKFDFAFEDCNFAVEVEGGIWMEGGGAHSHPSAIERDIEKYNAAQLNGWVVYRATPAMIKSGVAIDEIMNYLRRL